MYFIYRHRNFPASAAACAVVALAIYAQAHRMLPVKKQRADEPVQVTITELPSPPPPAPAPPPPPEPPRPAPVPTPAPTPPQPKVVERTPVPTPMPARVAEASPPRVESPPPATPPAPPSPPPAPPAPPAPSVDLSASYTSKVRAYLNGIKRYPTGREASIQRPEGKVRIWFIVRRDGSLVDAGVEDSSNSILLDNAGLATIKRGNLPAFEGAFGSEDQHRFTVDLDFKAPA